MVPARFAGAVLPLLLALLAPSLAVAQAPDAPHPSPENAQLWVHGTGDDQFNGFMNALEQDGNDDALGAGSLTNSAFTWTLTLQPSLAGAVILDTTKPILITAYIGASQGVGRVTVTTAITHGGEKVAEGAGVAHAITPATAAPDGRYGIVRWSLNPTLERLEPGNDLVWTMTATGTASSIFVGIGEVRGRTNMVLPISAVELGGGAPSAITKNVTADRLEDTIDLENSTSSSIVYNWTHNATDVAGKLAVTEGNGTVGLTVADANGTQVVNVSIEASADNETSRNQTIELAGEGAAGNWTVVLSLSEFSGVVQLLLGPVPPPDANVTGRPTNSSAPATSPTEEGGGIPGPAAGAVIAATLVAATLARRKRA